MSKRSFLQAELPEYKHKTKAQNNSVLKMKTFSSLLCAAALFLITEPSLALGINFSASPDFQKHHISSIIDASNQHRYIIEEARVFLYGSPSRPMPQQVQAEQVTASLEISDDWGSGYCATLVLKNAYDTDLSWEIAVPIEGRVRNLWNGRWSQSGEKLEVSGIGWNSILEAGELNTSIGFCAIR